MGRHRALITTAGAVLGLALATSACSWNRLDDSADAAPTITISDEMRTVPTVPSSDPTGSDAVDTSAAAGTPVDPASGENAADPAVPPTTALIGDPRPNPDSRATLPPLPDAPAIDACARLDLADASAQIGAATGAAVTTESSDQVCRFAAGNVVAVVHYVDEGALNGDWFRRDGIAPVGEVIADAVGLDAYQPPGADVVDGYTVALLYRRQGAIIAVHGTDDDRGLAVLLANSVVGAM